VVISISFLKICRSACGPPQADFSPETLGFSKKLPFNSFSSLRQDPITEQVKSPKNCAIPYENPMKNNPELV
jgi:hypothetical protein